MANEFEMHPEDIQKAKDDPVNHPSHYTSYKGLEVIQLTEQMNFNKGNAVKYISRAGLKDPDTEVQDLEKAKWYIQREIDRISIAPTAAQEILDANIRAFKDLSEEN